MQHYSRDITCNSANEPNPEFEIVYWSESFYLIDGNEFLSLGFLEFAFEERKRILYNVA